MRIGKSKALSLLPLLLPSQFPEPAVTECLPPSTIFILFFSQYLAVRKTLKVSKRTKKADLPKVPSVTSGEQRRARRPMQADIQEASLILGKLLSSERKREVEAKEIREALEALGAIDRQAALKQRRLTHFTNLWKQAMKKEKIAQQE